METEMLMYTFTNIRHSQSHSYRSKWKALLLLNLESLFILAVPSYNHAVTISKSTLIDIFTHYGTTPFTGRPPAGLSSRTQYYHCSIALGQIAQDLFKPFDTVDRFKLLVDIAERSLPNSINRCLESRMSGRSSYHLCHRRCFSKLMVETGSRKKKMLVPGLEKTNW